VRSRTSTCLRRSVRRAALCNDGAKLLSKVGAASSSSMSMCCSGLCRKSRRSTRWVSSANAPEHSTPVGPAPTTAMRCNRARSVSSPVTAARSNASSTWLRNASASSSSLSG
jgi:hypothetical protein